MERTDKTAVIYKDGKYEIEVVEFINSFGYTELWAYISAPGFDLLDKTWFFAHTLKDHNREEILAMIEKELPEQKRYYLEDMREREMED